MRLGNATGLSRWLALAAVLGLGLAPGSPAAEPPEAVRVFAAASLTNALTELGQAWTAAGHPQPSLSFASSGTLAKQIEAGAPADLFASADVKWMDYLDTRQRIDHASRRNLLATTLVLIAPIAVPGQAGPPKPVTVQMRRGFPFAQAFEGKLCTGEPDTVPAGIYARQALQALGWWDSLQGRIVGADDVRAALAFVERAECTLGIVYATDALVSQKVRVIATFPPDSHDPIVYPFALVTGARPAARAFLEQLSAAPAAAVFARYGFTVLPQ
jgi:molybdate transport system substrate-binding protein